MKTTIAILALFSAVSLSAAKPPAYVPPPESFPDNYTPAACAPPNSCASFPKEEVGANAFRFLGLEMNEKWIADHYDEIMALFAPICAKHATCVGTASNPVMFCTDLVAPMLYSSCDTKYKNDWDLENCRQFAQIYSLGVDQYSRKTALEAQACSAKTAVPHTKPPKIWMYPAQITRDYTGNVLFYALDPDTNVPVYAHITFQDQMHYAPSNPTGETATYYPFKLPFKYVREKNAQGHTDVLPPMVTFKTDAGYPDVQFRLPTPQPRVTVTIDPPLSKLKAGVENHVVVKAVDADSGKPAEMQVLLGDGTAGDTNQPITLQWPKGTKRPELWAKSLFDLYSDVVIAPTEK